MSRETVNFICASFPGAEVSDPWGGGHDAWKIGGKMFASIGAVTQGVAVKTDSVETAAMLIEMGCWHQGTVFPSLMAAVALGHGARRAPRAPPPVLPACPLGLAKETTGRIAGIFRRLTLRPPSPSSFSRHS